MSGVVEAVVPRRLGTGFRWLLASSWVSNLGDGFALAAGPLLVASQTDSPQLVALATLLLQLPWLLLALFAGAIADRTNRRLMVVVVDLARSAVLAVLTLAIVSHHVDIALVLAVLFLMGVAEVFGNTASATLLPMLVDRSDLGVANARLQAGFVTVNQLAGPPIGAALFAAAVWLAFAGQMVLVVIGALLVAQVHVPRVHAAPAAVQRVRTDIVDGIRWVLHHAAVRTLVLTILIFNVTFGAAWSVLVLYAKQRLGMGAIGFGLLTTSSAVGGLLGTLAYGWITRRITLGDVMRIGLIIETLTHLALALTTNAYVAIAIFFVFGAHAFVWGTTSATVRQRAVPIAMQGRVSGVNALCSYGGIVLGSAIGGPVAAAWGITAPFWFAFVGSAVFVVLIWRQLAHIAHDDDEPAGALAAAT